MNSCFRLGIILLLGVLSFAPASFLLAGCSGSTDIEDMEKARSAENRGESRDAENLWQAILDRGRDKKDDELILAASSGLFREYVRHKQIGALSRLMGESIRVYTKDAAGRKELASLLEFAHVHAQELYDERDIDNCEKLCREIAVLNVAAGRGKWDSELSYMFDIIAKRRIEHNLFAEGQDCYMQSLSGFTPQVKGASMAAENFDGLALCALRTGNRKPAITILESFLAQAAPVDAAPGGATRSKGVSGQSNVQSDAKSSAKSNARSSAKSNAQSNAFPQEKAKSGTVGAYTSIFSDKKLTLLFIDLGDLYRADGQTDRARASYKRALAFSPDSLTAKTALKSLSERRFN
jgi:tetratricopeptide (TPR) repeat protein